MNQLALKALTEEHPLPWSVEWGDPTDTKRFPDHLGKVLDANGNVMLLRQAHSSYDDEINMDQSSICYLVDFMNSLGGFPAMSPYPEKDC